MIEFRIKFFRVLPLALIVKHFGCGVISESSYFEESEVAILVLIIKRYVYLIVSELH